MASDPFQEGLSVLTTKGDILTFDTALQRLAVEANHKVLNTDSTTATGVAWVDGGTVLFRSTSVVTVVNTTDETTVFSGTVPANAFSTNRMLIVYLGVSDWDDDTNARTCTIRAKYGGTTFASDNEDPAATFSNASGIIFVRLWATGATNAQAGWLRSFIPGASGQVEGVGTAAVDSTAAQTFLVSAQWNTAGAAATITFNYGVCILV